MTRVLHFMILLPLHLLGQWNQKEETDFTNFKTKQYLSYSWSGKIGEKEKYYVYYLFTKSNHVCERKEIRVRATNSEYFIDSLKKIGFKNKFKLIDRKSEYKIDIEMISVKFDTISKTDSIYKFKYKLTMTNLKSNTAQMIIDTIYRSNKEKVLETFKVKDIRVINVDEVKGTSISILRIYSSGLYEPEQGPWLFGSVKCFHF